MLQVTALRQGGGSPLRRSGLSFEQKQVIRGRAELTRAALMEALYFRFNQLAGRG